jgi:hypothetical protein
VSTVRSGEKRAVAAILAGIPSKRTADKCARLYRPATLVALRRGLETYETAALPLSYSAEPRGGGRPLCALPRALQTRQQRTVTPADVRGAVKAEGLARVDRAEAPVLNVVGPGDGTSETELED